MTGFSSTRCSLRNAMNQPVSLELTCLEQGKINAVRIEGTCVDISSDGMGMTTNGPLRTGAVLKLLLSVNDMKVTLPILSEVKWIRQADNQYRVGLQFLA